MKKEEGKGMETRSSFETHQLYTQAQNLPKLALIRKVTSSDLQNYA